MKYIYYIFIALLPFLCSSCCCWNKIPPGKIQGPIVNDPEPEETILSGKVAANRMTTSLVMHCPAITDSGNEKPKVINNFVISSRKVNYLQMQVWRSLINMDMIHPVSDKKEDPAFELESEITRLPGGGNGKVKYSWIMSMLRIVDKKEVWSKQIEFGE